MNYLKITKFIYLGIGFIMLYDAYSKWSEEPKPWLSLVLAGLAFFTFFFRSRFDKKFQERKSEAKPNGAKLNQNSQNSQSGTEQSEANQNTQNNP